MKRERNLTPEQQEKIAKIKTARSTSEAQAREEEIRQEFADISSRDELIRRGMIDPERTSTMGALIALRKTKAALVREREARGVTLTELSKRSGIALPSLSRIEGNGNHNVTFETLARYAAALGFSLEIVLQDSSEAHSEEPSRSEDPQRQIDIAIDHLNRLRSLIAESHDNPVLIRRA